MLWKGRFSFMKKPLLIALATLLAAGALLSGCTAQPVTQPVAVIDDATGQVSAAVPTISVSGTGELVLIPDMATVQFSVEASRKDNAGEAMEAASQTMDAIAQALGALGVAEEDMQTTNFYMYEQYQYDKNGNPTGAPKYNVSNTLSVKIYDIDNVGQYIDEAIAAGATGSHGISFDVKDPRARENEALQLALENARSRAEALAAAAGKKVGDVLLLNDGTQLSEQVVYDMEPAAAERAYDFSSSGSSSKMQAGTYKLTAKVSVRYTLAS